MFVDLQVVYPSPEEPCTELSFEEIWAANRGLLDCSWDEEDVSAREEESPPAEEAEPSQVDLLAEAVATKLVVHHDVVMLDENGAIKDYPRGRPEKKRVMEVNETQISRF